MASAGEVLQRLGNTGDNLDWVRSNAEGECADARPQFVCETFYAQTLKGVAQGIGKAVDAVSVCLD